MEKKQTNVSLPTCILAVLFVIAILAIVFVVIQNNQLKVAKEEAEAKASQMQTAVTEMETAVNDLQGKMDTISNITSSNKSTNTTKKSDEDIVEELVMNQLKEYNDERTENDVDKWIDYKVDNVEVITGNERKQIVDEFFPNAKADDIFAYATYSVKPKDINTATVAGNGEIKGEWIEHSWVIYISFNNGTYKLESAGTGW